MHNPATVPSWARPFTDLLPAKADTNFLRDDTFTADWTTANGSEWTVVGAAVGPIAVRGYGPGYEVHGADLPTRIDYLVRALRVRGALPAEGERR